GFVLLIEQAHIDKYSHDKNFEGAAEKANTLNDTVNAALAFAEGRDDTVIIVTTTEEGSAELSERITELMKNF
ncbi:MAG: alkaline phosphatase, partial [Clostridia bacterium]|nr:alkaline phosphatase [Clostridia bacterium]